MRYLATIAAVFMVFGYWAQMPVSVFDCSVIDPTASQAEIDVNDDYYKQCILFTDQENYVFDQDDYKVVTALHEISIKENFHAGPFNSGGQMHLIINPNRSDFDVAVMNYTELNNVIRYEKFELGIVLPEAIQIKIDNFVADAQGEKINPYMDWEIRVYAEFISPSGPGAPVDGFYNKEFNSYMVNPLPVPNNGFQYTDSEYTNVGGYIEVVDLYSFRLRFAPPENGIWECKVHIVTPLENYESAPFNFNVVQGDNLGYLSAGKRFFKLGSQTFFPVGPNAIWPETYKEFDLEFTDKNKSEATGLNALEEGYRPIPVAPRVYDTYKNEAIGKMIDNGANMIRTIMYPTSTEIEWEELGNYTSRLSMAQEMDEILEYVESRNAYLLWDLQIHYSFQNNYNAYSRRWTWNVDNNGVFFCYKDLLGNVEAVEFLKSAQAKAYYKQRLRYILARWGYSTNIGMFEIMSEISNIGAPQADNADFYKTDDNYKIYRDWQWEMGKYIRSHYNGNVHMLTCNFAGDKAVKDDLFTATNSPFDVMGSNIYDFNEPSNSEFWINTVSKNHLNAYGNNSYTNVTTDSLELHIIGSFGDTIYSPVQQVAHKPMIYAEVGIPEVESKCRDNQIETNRIIWQAAFSGLAGTFGYDAYWRLNAYQNYGKLKQFISGIDFEGEGWHPGASEKSGLSWAYENNYAKKMIGNHGKADLAYLRSGDGKYAIGVLTNLTYNVYSAKSCFDQILDIKTNSVLTDLDSLWNPLPNTIENVNTYGNGGEDLKLKGMNGGNYIIDYFLPSNLSVPFTSTEDYGPNVKIELNNFGGSEDTYIVLFKARRSNVSWIPAISDSLTQNVGGQLVKSLSTREELENSKLIAYPIPSSEIVKLETPIEGLTVIVSSLDGRTMETFSINGVEHHLNVSNYEVGTYILSFYNGNGFFGELRIVKI